MFFSKPVPPTGSVSVDLYGKLQFKNQEVIKSLSDAYRSPKYTGTLSGLHTKHSMS